MAQTVTVKQGDHITAIAEKYGFLDYNIIWNHPNNAELKKKRVNPHVILPGDQIFIPDKKLKTETVSTTKVHFFRVNLKPLQLRIALKDFDDLPIANADCELHVEGSVYQLKTDKDGRIEKEIPTTAENGLLKVPDLGIEFPIKIGHLDPEDEPTGWKARLINLGYYPGGLEDENAEELKHAIEEFQCDQKLPVTGELDAATLSKLKQVHGC
jgi:N-acetylmuramoyl-L-alanine amidase